ncbi:hypothetical protein LTR36_000764 [Oleoguttula mirabilis]|uniref:Alb1-domain-containing protein n=1 Tax=Oleoguttula mirabilis TaxID=1507867 RepID=A0AAV9J3Q1_9PEZI|nr:hypothetical protein LTR36_000764 [Oleoguttula mirabilis]
MAKTAKVKKREVSFRSRAARRGESPPPKDLAVKAKPSSTAKAPVEETDYKPWLHTAQSAGISKKKKGKQLTRQQKVRQLRALERADVLVDKHERKVADSKARSKKIQARAKDWEELNENLVEKKEGGDVGVTKPAEAAGSDADDGTDEKEMEDVQVPDLEQPLPMGGSEGGVSQPGLAEPSTAGVTEDVDEVT